jgi:hypothetical protein
MIALDNQLIKEIMQAKARRTPSPFVLNDMLRAYFSNLSERFLSPINRYFASLYPPSTYSVSIEPLALSPFRTADCLRSLQDGALHAVKFKASIKPNTRTEFYRMYLNSVNHILWLQRKTLAGERELKRRQVRTICDLDLGTWCSEQRDEADIRRLLSVLHRTLLDTMTKSPGGVELSVEQKKRLERQQDILISRLPDELKHWQRPP